MGQYDFVLVVSSLLTLLTVACAVNNVTVDSEYAGERRPKLPGDYGYFNVREGAYTFW